MEPATGKSSKVIPANAFRELKEGEVYEPVVSPDQSPPEVTLRSVLLGVFAVVVFTFAAAYIGLKTGNVIETSIPIAILAVFIGNTLMQFFGRRNHLLENVIIQSLGQASGVVVAGAIFTIPALYINELQPRFLHIFLACLLGGYLGVVLLIPLRRYFVKDLHGKLPFPEATAIANVLGSGEKSKGAGGKVLLMAFGLGFVFDLIVEFMKLWNAHINSRVLFGRFGEFMAERRFELKFNATAVFFGLGYIIGPRYAGIIAAGSVLSFVVLVPLVYAVGASLQIPLTPPVTDVLIRDMDATAIFDAYVRPMGIGCIAVAGLIGIIKMGKIILSSLSLAFKGMAGKGGGGERVRTDQDISPVNTFLIQVACVVALLLFFWWVSGSIKTALIGTVITYCLAFLFTPVAAQAIAIVGVNPVSGMTLITLILACLVLVATGLGGDALGQTIALVIGCAVCTALSTSGAFVTDLKIGYWMGAGPYQQQRWKYLGILVASLCVGGVIWVMANSYGFRVPSEVDPTMMVPNPDLPAPQGNLMAAIVSAVMGGEQPPLLLYALGGLVAVLLEMARIPALPFGLGMYLPIQINLAIFAGAGVGHFISRTGKDDEERAELREQGTLIASGIMAGAAIIGTIGACLLLPEIGEPMSYIDLVEISGETGGFTHWFEGLGGQLVSALGFLGLGFLCYLLAKKGLRWTREEEEQG